MERQKAKLQKVKMVKVFDLKAMESYPYEERDKNVFYKAKEFKAKIVELPAGGEMSTCEMTSYVVFYVIKGAAEVNVNQEKASIKEGQCLITNPATLAMRTNVGIKIIGIQVVKS